MAGLAVFSALPCIVFYRGTKNAYSAFLYFEVEIGGFMLKRSKYVVSAFFACMLFMTTVVQATEIARVIAVTGGVTVEHAGQSKALALKDSLRVKDIVRTNATGKVQLMFTDDTIVSLGTNSQFAMEDYSSSGMKSFKSNVAVGFVRFVTGTIVENNPEAFTVRTPEATVGIRGTTFSVDSRDRITKVFTESSLNSQSVVVKNVVIAPNYMATFGPNGELLSGPTLMTPEQRELLIESSRIGNPVAGVGLGGLVQPLTEEQIQGSGGTDSLEHTLADSRYDDLHENPLSSEFVNNVNAVGSGTFEFEDRGGANKSEGTFSFDANLSTGNLSNANFNTTNPGAGTFTATGGTGSANANGFTLGGGTATFTPTGGASGPIPTDWGVVGDEALEFGDSFEGDLTITNNTAGTLNGEIDGELSPK